MLTNSKLREHALGEF